MIVIFKEICYNKCRYFYLFLYIHTDLASKDVVTYSSMPLQIKEENSPKPTYTSTETAKIID